MPASRSSLDRRWHSMPTLGAQPLRSSKRTDGAPASAHASASAPGVPTPTLPPRRSDRKAGQRGMEAAAAAAPASSSETSEASKTTSAAPSPATRAAKPAPRGFRAMPSSRSSPHLARPAPSAVAPAAAMRFSSRSSVCSLAPQPASRAPARAMAPMSPRKHFQRPISSRLGSGALRRPSASACALPEGGPNCRLGICSNAGLLKTMFLLISRMSSSTGGGGGGSGSGGGRRHGAVRGTSISSRSARSSSTLSKRFSRSIRMCGTLQMVMMMCEVKDAPSAMACFRPAEAQEARAPGARIFAATRKRRRSSASAAMAARPAEPPIMLSSEALGLVGAVPAALGGSGSGPSSIRTSIMSSGTSASAARGVRRLPSMSARRLSAFGPGPISL
mmetsp:Transcript_9298/g.28667  ORF Transcript_9298/g.28667 Transcript_9298/m.28667 type:complete len:390 (+) Transcript_9298:51-1220(+)